MKTQGKGNVISRIDEGVLLAPHLAALRVTPAVAGAWAHALCGATPGDGGGGFFYAEAGDFEDDGVNTIVTASGVAWRREPVGGAALSDSLGPLVPASPSLFLYVGGEGASDSNNGSTPETSLATLDEAMSRNPTSITLLSSGSRSISQAHLSRPRTGALAIYGDLGSWTVSYEDLAFTGAGHVLTITAWADPEDQPEENALVGKIVRLSGGAYRAIAANVDDTIRINYPVGIETGPLDIVDFDAEIALPAVVHGGVARTSALMFSGVTIRPSEIFAQYPEIRGAVNFNAQVSNATSTIHFVRADFAFTGADSGHLLSCRDSACAMAFSQCTGKITGRFGALHMRAMASATTPEIGDFYVVGAACTDLTVRHSTVNAEVAELVVSGTLDLDRFSDLIRDGGTDEGPYSGAYPVPP
jgi:hypothetical protein